MSIARPAKPGSITKGMDLFYAYRIVTDLATPFNQTGAFKLGLIDGNGKRLKKAKTSEEKAATSYYFRLILNMKRMLSKVGLNSRFATFAAALFLLKEGKMEGSEEEILIELNEYMDYMKQHKQFKDIVEDAPANATGAAVAGTGDTGDAWVKLPYRIGPKGEKRRKGRYINGIEYLKRVAREAERKRKDGSSKT